MKHYDEIERGLQAFLTNPCLLSASQLRRIVQLCTGLVLAGRCQLRLMARWIRRSGRQNNRIQWVRRCLDAAFLRPEYVYEPFVKHLLVHSDLAVWHVLMDRTHVEGWKEDVVMVSLYYRKRSLPLVWGHVPSGRCPSLVALALLKRAAALLPKGAPVIFQGDCEFGTVALLKWIKQQGWDFIVAQTGQTHFRQRGSREFQALSSLAVTRTQPQRLSHVFLSSQHDFGEVNLYAFYQPHHKDATRRTRKIQYLATSLPFSRLIRTLGKRRWGVECLFRDLKSAGWDMETSRVTTVKRRSALLTLIALCYLWLTFIGRWLCKTGHRYWVDHAAQRHLSLFHIGWDWLVYQWRCGLQCPHLSRVYF